MSRSPGQIMEHVLSHDRLWLFLDYDGTLADFVATPDLIVIDPEVVALITRLARCSGVRVAVISGRTLCQVRELLPVPRIFLAGTYGVELYTPDGELLLRAERSRIRPALEQLKPIWQQLISDRTGFFLEDKGWALALHVRFAHDAAADQVLSSALASIPELASSSEFRVLHSQRFLEVGPAIARKDHTVDYMLDRFAWPGALPVYLGDDDQDEDAFATIKAHHGVALLVAALQRPTLADAQLTSPRAVRGWLNQLAERLSVQTPP